jgi:SH3-like domain-containing protein
VLVVAENGDYRKTRRANGSELWTHWMSLSPCSTACDWITDNIDKVWKKQAAEHKGYFGRNRPSP